MNLGAVGAQQGSPIASGKSYLAARRGVAPRAAINGLRGPRLARNGSAPRRGLPTGQAAAEVAAVEAKPSFASQSSRIMGNSKDRATLQDLEHELEVLAQQIEGLFAGLDRRTAIAAKILELGYRINAEYDHLRRGDQNPEAVEQLQRSIQPIQAEIEALRTESNSILASIGSAERAAREIMVKCARQVPHVTPLLDRFREIYASRTAPDVLLLKLRQLVTEGRAALQSSPEGETSARPDDVIKTDAEAVQLSLGPTAKRFRGPKIELHRERLALWKRLAEELATIWQETRKFATLDGLKRKYPDFQIWTLLAADAQRELLERKFNPKAYAGNLVLRKYGLKSLETLRRSREIVRAAEPKQA